MQVLECKYITTSPSPCSKSVIHIPTVDTDCNTIHTIATAHLSCTRRRRFFFNESEKIITTLRLVHVHWMYVAPALIRAVHTGNLWLLAGKLSEFACSGGSALPPDLLASLIIIKEREACQRWSTT